MTKYWVFRIASRVVPLVPMWLARPLAIAIGTLLWALASGTRQRTQRNLRHIPVLAEHPDQLYVATRGVFQHMTLNYLDFFRGPRLSDEELRAGWTIENEDLFNATMAQGRGLIIFSGHLGNFEFGASRLGALGYDSVSPVEHMQPESLFQLFRKLREHHRLHVVVADSRDSLRELLDALKRGEIVIFLVDRFVLGASADVSFFGETAKLPTGPFALALRSGAPAMSVFSWRTGPGRSHGVFVPLDPTAVAPETPGIPEEMRTRVAGPTVATRTRTVRSTEQTLRMQRQFLDELEKRIADHPEQWVAALSPIWDEE